LFSKDKENMVSIIKDDSLSKVKKNRRRRIFIVFKNNKNKRSKKKLKTIRFKLLL
jgi:hypothetical protein